MPKTCSPLRYPGGKTKLYNLIKPIIIANITDGIYIEPFAGGAGLALKLLFSGDVEQLVLNDIDYHIYSFWKSSIEYTDEMCNMIDQCEINMETWNEQKNIYCTASCHTLLEVGFATFFLNRCNVSGVIQGGPIGGKKQTGKYLIDARFNRKDLINKINIIGENRTRISFYNLDAANFLQKEINKFPIEKSILNIDPPYVKKGAMLYENSFTENDHSELANVIQLLRHKWIVTYDKCELIHNLYESYRKTDIILNYSAGQTKSGEELIIFGPEVKI